MELAVGEKPLKESERRGIIIGVLTAMLLAALDQTIVAPALPTIGAKLGIPILGGDRLFTHGYRDYAALRQID